MDDVENSARTKGMDNDWMGPTSYQSIFDISSFSVVAVTYMSTPTI